MGEQKWAPKTNIDWKGVTPFAQVHDVYNGDSKSILIGARIIFQLECKEFLECYFAEMHMGVTFDWLLHTHGCHMKDKWHVKVKFWKGKELTKLSKCKARNLQECKRQDAQLGSEERKAKVGEEGKRKSVQRSLYSCS